MRDHLASHPDIFWATRDEIHYFDWSFDQGTDWYRAWFPLRSELARHERAVGRPAVAGEKTPYYLVTPGVAQSVREVLPDVRLVVTLREPVDRAYSHWRMNYDKGAESLSFEDALAAEPDRLADVSRTPPNGSYQGSPLTRMGYLRHGRYGEHLEPWFEAFDPSQILVLRSEDLYADPEIWVPRVLEHVGVDPHGLDGAAYPTVNAGEVDYPDLDPALRARVSEQFVDDDARLFELTGLSYRSDVGQRDRN